MSQSADISVKRSALPANLIFVIIIGIFAISSSSVFIRYAQGEGVPSLLIGAARLTIAAILLTPFVLHRYRAHLQRLTLLDWLLALTSGLFLALHFATWVSSLEYTTVLISTVVVTTSPIWVALLEFVFLRTRLSRPVALGLAIAITGGLVIGFSGGTDIDTAGNNHLLGGALSLAGAVSVAIYFVVGRKLRAKMPVIPYIWLVYGCAGMLMLMVVGMNNIPLVGYNTPAYVWLLAVAVLPQLIGHSSLNYAIGYLPATVVSIITQTEPIGSAILALLLFSEIPTVVQLLGSAIILGGVTLATVAPQRAASTQ